MATPLPNPHQHYLKTQIETASQPKLLLMIFDAAVKKLHMSKKAIEQKEIEKAHIELTKLQRIFTELMVALDVKKGGELAENLLRVYDFVYHHLVKANIKQDSSLIDEVIPIVEDLQDGWHKAVEKFIEEGSDEAIAMMKPIQNTQPRASYNSQLPRVQNFRSAAGQQQSSGSPIPLNPVSPMQQAAYQRPVTTAPNSPAMQSPMPGAPTPNAAGFNSPYPNAAIPPAATTPTTQSDKTPQTPRPRLNLKG